MEHCTALLIIQHKTAILLQVVVTVKRMGGGFGGKESRSVPLSAVVAVAAAKTGRPVRLMLDRDEDMAIR